MAEAVSANIGAIFARKEAAVVGLCIDYAGRILAEFQKRQGDQGGFLSGATQFWTNQTAYAARTVFAEAIIEDDELGFFIAHLAEYGVYLEMANDRKNEALRPLIEEFFPQFKKDLAYIYGDGVAA